MLPPRQQNKSSVVGHGFAVRINSGGLILGTYIGKQPPTTFEHVQIPLDEKSGWYNRGTGNLATKEEVLCVLARLEAIEIRADFTIATDNVGWLDNVKLIAGPMPPIVGSERPRSLVIEGSAGATYQIQFQWELDPVSAWMPFMDVTLPDIPVPRPEFQHYEPIMGRTNIFFRAVVMQ